MAVSDAIGSVAWAMRDSDAEIECLALTIYFEARGEPDIGKFAVGHVVMNRTADRRFPRRVCDVVWQRDGESGATCQFSWACDTLRDEPTDMKAWRASTAIARWIYFRRSRDPTGGALWYHADYVSPGWKTAVEPGHRIGHHIFYRKRDNFLDWTGAMVQTRTSSHRGDASFSAAIRQISQSIGALVPGLKLSVLVYSKEPSDRFARINNALYREGDLVAHGLTLEAITPDGIVLQRDDRRIQLSP